MKSDTILIYAASVQDADQYYATRFKAPDPFLYLRIRGRSVIVLSDLEAGRGRRQARVDRVLRYSELSGAAGRALRIENPSLPDVAAWFLRSKGVRRVSVPSNFGLGTARALEKRGILVVPKPDPFFEDRSRKRRDEVEALRRALRLTEKALAKAERVLRTSRVRGSRLYSGSRPVTSEYLRRVLHLSLAEDGLTASHTIVACGNDACDPHAEGSGPVKPRHAIVMDVFPRSSQTLYWADITRSFVKGRAAPRLRALYEAVKEGQAAALGTLRAGVRACDVHRAAARVFEERGYRNTERRGVPAGFIHGTGHGVGLEIHEPPRLNASSVNRLRSGEVVTVEPGLYYPGLGGVRLEDMALVTATGCINMTRYPKHLEIP